MGDVTMKALTQLQEEGLVHFPGEARKVWSFGYLMQPTPKTMTHPERIQKYRKSFAELRRVATHLDAKPMPKVWHGDIRARERAVRAKEGAPHRDPVLDSNAGPTTHTANK